MNALLVISGFAAALTLAILKTLAADEIRGRIQRHITASVEATIASLPPELAAEWAEEWRAELAAVISMPVAAARLALGLRDSASQLCGQPAGVPAGARAGPPQSRSTLKHLSQRMRSARHEKGEERKPHGSLSPDRIALLSSASKGISWRAPSAPSTPASSPSPPASSPPSASAT
jgi:hypothetical protein